MDDLVERLRAIGEEEMYQAPATTKATIDEAADHIEQLQRQLADAVANEREACAKVAEDLLAPWDGAYNMACRHIAAAIRERTD